MNRLTKIFDRIEVSSLLSEHLTTFYHYEKRTFHNKTEIPTSDKIVFLVIPLTLAILLCISGLRFTKDYVDITLTSLSIFTGLLFTLLTMILSLVQENAKIDIANIPLEKQKQTSARIDLTQHLFVNIAFSIVLSILSLLLVLSTQFYPEKLVRILSSFKYYGTVKLLFIYLTNGISFFLLIEFFLTLLMIIKRFAVLFLNQTNKL